ncbi:hypothetical protein DPMN_004461 [Dreissena polymorpha]|uniref:TIR domain-containing protein n=1 Tax=Dreissena polymorpha TaxID=45954 RepID=A0A9D4RVM4_DREPO|nr:hypothetical protein DPMN_004461 [Dreissena polymorpha]
MFNLGITFVLMTGLSALQDMDPPGTCDFVQRNTACRCRWNKNGFDIDCSWSNITSVPDMLPKNVIVTLNLTSTRVGLNLNTDVPFQDFSILEVLDLYNASLGSKVALTNTTFIGLNRLKHLNISGNERLPLTQKSTDGNLFSNLHSLVTLRMYGTTGTYNVAKGYPESTLARIGNLQELWIDGLTNRDFGETFRNMSTLKTLRLSGDVVIPPWRSLEFCETNVTETMLGNLIHITDLSILKCNVKNIHAQAFLNVTKLEFLDLSGNQLLTLEGVSKVIGSISTTLKTLILDSVENSRFLPCGIKITKDMGERFQRLTNLKKLSVEDNAINSIDEHAFESLSSLEHLHAARNELQLGFYVFRVQKMTNLKTLDISNNFFTDDIGIWSRVEKKTTTKNVFWEIPDKYPDSSNINFLHSYGNNLVLNSGSVPKGSTLSSVKGPSKSTCPKRDYFIPRCIVTGFLPPNLESLDISNSKIGVPIYEYCIFKNNSLKTIIAAGSLLYCWEGPMHGVQKLENVDLSRNFATTVQEDFFDDAPNLLSLNLGTNLLYRPIMRNGRRLFKNNVHLEMLDLSFNRIETVDDQFLENQKEMKHLNLSFNIMNQFTVNITHMTKLRMLDLSNNQIKSLSKDMCATLVRISQTKITDKPFYLNLSNNNIKCDCLNIDFLKWVSKHMGKCRFLNITISNCVFTENSSTVEINSYNDLKKHILFLEKECKSYKEYIIGGTIILAIVLHIVAGMLIHRYRWKIRYWLYVTSSKMKTRAGYISIDSLSANETYRYHVYLASEVDNAFVRSQLESKLTGRGYKLFLPEHIVPGQNNYRLIANAIHISRSVLFVISAGWEHDTECKIAIHMAQEESLRRGKPMFFAVFLESTPEIGWSSDTLEIRRRCFLDFPKNGDAQEVAAFWRELYETIDGMDNAPVLLQYSAMLSTDTRIN